MKTGFSQSAATFAALLFCGASAIAQEKVQTRLNATSEPSGATVVIDGVARGTTPLTLFDVAPGRHHLKYRLAGYVDSDLFFSTAEGPYIEKSATLEAERGLLLLKTEPEGCDIQIDGVSVGRTPRLVTDLSAAGVYSVKLRKDGYQDQTIRVKFDGRRPLVRTEKMVLDSGTVEITSEPAGAEVTVNGIVKGKTPLKVSGVPKGRATVKFALDGYAGETRELSVNAGDEQTLSIALKALPGTLRLLSVPEGARFYINEVAKGKGPVVAVGLRPGEYKVRAELEGYGTVTKTVKLGNGDSVQEEFKLSNVMGRIEVRSNPSGAEVHLDGKRVGVTGSKDPSAEFSDIFAIENVLEGEHTIVLKKDGYADFTRRAEVKSAKTAKHHRMMMRRIFTPDVELVTSRGVYRGVLVSSTADSVKLEVKPGIEQRFPKNEIRKMSFLKKEK